ncbi:MAG: hypothetical protein H7176_00925 [Bdellovibrionales bacterium]|nr:hypothetical protein [Massilia sp.]
MARSDTANLSAHGAQWRQAALGWVPDVYALADMRDAQALFFNHSDNFQFATGIEISALPRHAKKAPRTLLPQGPFVPTQSQLRPAKLRWEIAIRRVTHHV